MPRDSELKHVVVLAGSAGALPVMLRQVDRLFVKDRSCLFLIYHRSPGVPFDLARLVPDDVVFEPEEARDDVELKPNRIYYPHDANDVVVKDGRLVVTPPAGRYRPSIDRLLESLASEFTDRVIAILLSGMGSDGVQGLLAVKRRGGRTIVQDPAVARHASLPAAAITAGAADHILTTGEILAMVDDALAGRLSAPR